MKKLATALFALTVFALVAAVWLPIGAWWQWLLTAVVLLFLGAAISAESSKNTDGQG